MLLRPHYKNRARPPKDPLSAGRRQAEGREPAAASLPAKYGGVAPVRANSTPQRTRAVTRLFSETMSDEEWSRNYTSGNRSSLPWL